MARSARVAGSGPGYFGLIFFIVLCLVLIAGYVPLWMGYAKLSQSLDALHSDIKDNLEEPLKEDLHVSAGSRVSTADVAYEAKFFRTVKEAALDGVRYGELMGLTGWKDGETETAVAQITDELKKGEKEYSDLRSYIGDLRTKLTDATNRLKQSQSLLDGFTAKYEEAQQKLRKHKADYDALMDEKAKAVQAEKNTYTAKRDEMQRLVNAAQGNEKKAWAKLDEETNRLNAKVDALSKNVESLAADNNDLKKKLADTGPQKVAIKEGKIIKANLIEGIAIIDKGKRENILVGEKFTVMHVARGGTRIPKGELQVIRVDELCSQAHIMAQVEDNPIMRDDIVWRQKEYEMRR